MRTGYSESETLILLIRLLDLYPDLFKFNLLDYNTTKGVDFVVEHGGSPKYIEMKGSFLKDMNHAFRNVYKFICYDIEMSNGDIAEDVEEIKAKLIIKKDDKFESFDAGFDGKKFTGFKLQPDTVAVQSMEIIVLKKLLTEVVGATFE